MTLSMAKARPIYQDGSPDGTDKQPTQTKLPHRFAANAHIHRPSDEPQHEPWTRLFRSATLDVHGRGTYIPNGPDNHKRKQHVRVKAPTHRNHKSYGDIPSPETRRYTEDLCITDAEHLEALPMPKRVASEFGKQLLMYI